MAHELDMTQGRAAVFSVLESMWHREGIVLDHPPTIKEGLEHALMGWTTDKRQVFLETWEGSNEYVPAKDFRAICRSDMPLQPLAVLPKSYTPLQNLDAFRVFQPLLDNGLAQLETAGSLRGGKHVWVLVKLLLPEGMTQEVYQELGLAPYGLITNNHTGERAVMVGQTTIRVVCANTERMATQSWEKGLKPYVKVKHTSNVESRLVEEAAILWDSLLKRHAIAAEQYQLLKATYLDETMFRSLILDQFLPLPQTAFTNRQLTQYETQAIKRGNLEHLWRYGVGHVADQSAWEAYNAITQAVDHGTDNIFPIRGRMKSRLTSEMTGRLGDIKSAAIETLVSYATVGASATPQFTGSY